MVEAGRVGRVWVSLIGHIGTSDGEWLVGGEKEG